VRVLVNGVMREITTDVETHLKKQILKYKELCLLPSDGWASISVNIFAMMGKTVLNADIVKAAPTADASFARLTITATNTIAIRVQMKVKVRSFIFCQLPALRSCQRTVF
jgi:hypothetical protein